MRNKNSGDAGIERCLQVSGRTGQTHIHHFFPPPSLIVITRRSFTSLTCSVEAQKIDHFSIIVTPLHPELSSQYVLSNVIVDEQRRISNSGVDATAYFANADRKGKVKNK
jgi:hypothetical protein